MSSLSRRGFLLASIGVAAAAQDLADYSERMRSRMETLVSTLPEKGYVLSDVAPNAPLGAYILVKRITPEREAQVVGPVGNIVAQAFVGVNTLGAGDYFVVATQEGDGTPKEMPEDVQLLLYSPERGVVGVNSSRSRHHNTAEFHYLGEKELRPAREAMKSLEEAVDGLLDANISPLKLR